MADPDIAALAVEIRMLRDMEDIRTLMARYHLACDATGQTATPRDPDDIASLFVPDGEWGSNGNIVTGRDAILARARQVQSVFWILHIVANPIVTIDGDVATATFKGFVRSRMVPAALTIWSIGRYDVVAVRTPEGWRLRSLAWESLDKPEG